MTITRNTALAVILCTISFSGGLKAADLDDGLVTYYPFDGDANDESGNHNNETVYGATLAVDRNGIPNSAYNRALSEAEIAELYEDTETEDFLPLERGQVFSGRETDDTGTLSRFNYVALNEFVASCNGQSYRMGLVGNRRGIKKFPIRSTATQLFGFQSSNCTEQLLWQNAPVGTSWSYDEIDGSTTYVTVEATNETVVVPAGTFEGCLKFRKTAPSWGGDWVEWVQPGFFFIKMEDYSMPPYLVDELVRYRLPTQD